MSGPATAKYQLIGIGYVCELVENISRCRIGYGYFDKYSDFFKLSLCAASYVIVFSSIYSFHILMLSLP